MFDYELLEKLEHISLALHRLAEAQVRTSAIQVRTSIIEFAKLNEDQKRDYWEAIADLRKNGWSSVFKPQKQECNDCNSPNEQM
jgi:hypothetical protein